MRAYGDAAAQALSLAPRRTGTLAVRFRICYPYLLTGPVMRALGRSGATDIHHGYAPGGSRGAVEGVRVLRFSLQSRELDWSIAAWW